MRCPRCGKKNKNNAQFCKSCDYPFQHAPVNPVAPSAQPPSQFYPQTQTKVKEKSKIPLYIGIGFVVLIALMLLVSALKKGTLTKPQATQITSQLTSQEQYDSYVRVIEEFDSEGLYVYSVRLNDTCDWESLSKNKKTQIAQYFIEKCQLDAEERGYEDFQVFGYDSNDKFIFNRVTVM